MNFYKKKQVTNDANVNKIWLKDIKIYTKLNNQKNKNTEKLIFNKFWLKA